MSNSNYYSYGNIKLGKNGFDLPPILIGTIFYQNETIIERNSFENHETFGIMIYLLHAEHGNQIIKNNFINNNHNAMFLYFPHLFTDKIKSYWDGNYWNSSRLLPKMIFGGKCRVIFDKYPIIIPWFEIDWNPAKLPNDITTTHGCDIK